MNKTQQKMVKLFFKTMLLTFLTLFFAFAFVIGNFNPFSDDWGPSRFVLILVTGVFGAMIFGFIFENESK